MPTNKLSRRHFLQSSAAGIAIAGFPSIIHSKAPNEKLNIAIIGCGGRGAANLNGVKSENIVALCDVNDNAVAKAAQTYPHAKTFRDYRKLYDELKDGDFDAVVVSTCEHTHAFATLPALQRKKHVYCEKPLTHNVREARTITEAAKKAGVATQMGTQIHASGNYRRVVELIQAGVIGGVTEAHVWVSRAWGWQSPEDAKKYKDIVSITERPTSSMPIPKTLDWDLWLGPSVERPFNDVYVPGPKWYRWWDFGSGTMSDLGSHWNDLPFWALKLDSPRTIEANGPPVHADLAPASMSATYEYGPRGDMPAVKLSWYQGTAKPDIHKEGGIPRWDNGILFIGSKGMLLADYAKILLLPEKDFTGFQPPPKSIPDSLGHYAEWIHAAKTNGRALCDFSYSGPLTEANHLGNVAYRCGKKIEWEPRSMTIPNAREAEKFLGREYRKGWGLV